MKLSDQEREILVDELCALIDNLFDLLIAVDPAPPFGVPFIGWKLPASRERSEPRRQARPIDDKLDLPRCIPVKSPSSPERSERSEPVVLYPLAYPLKAVWSKKNPHEPKLGRDAPPQVWLCVSKDSRRSGSAIAETDRSVSQGKGCLSWGRLLDTPLAL